jgi:ferredoxin
MSDIYEELATHLDNLPAGFPRTDSGVELRILKRLFTPDEAELATKLSMIPETAEQIAERLGEDDEILAGRLDSMAGRGLLFRSSRGGNTTYMAAQFIVGIWEYHVQDLDEGLIRDVNEYLPHIMRRAWMETRTKQMRVIPVSESLEAESTVMPYEQAEEIVRQQSKIVLAPCICRKEQTMIGNGCDMPQETCLVFGGAAHFYEENRLGRPISVEEALEVLTAGQESGLVLQPSNSQKPVSMCLCCGCCCQILKNLKTFDNPAEAVHTNFYAEVIPEECTACGECESRCQMEAISVGETAEVDLSRCIGCGLCVTACQFGAVRLRRYDSERQYEPPKNVVETYMNMAKERGLL